MEDRNYLIELSYLLHTTPTQDVGDSRGTKYIMIEANTAKEIADRLKQIADTMILH